MYQTENTQINQNDNRNLGLEIPYSPTNNPNIPFDVSRELSQYQKVFITKQWDMFRMAHCYEGFAQEYLVWAELPDGDKKLIFTCCRHFEPDCCKCNDLKLHCFCFAYICCDQIIFQMDYRRNGKCFYTQGLNIRKGCYCCQCNCFGCGICDCPSYIETLYLRENVEPNNPNPDIGIKKGKTTQPCCECKDKRITYITQEGITGPATIADYCQLCENNCLKSCFFLSGYNCGVDIDIDIKDNNGTSKGRITVYNGLCSKKTDGKCCSVPRSHMEINMPPNSTSEERFQIIADLIHFALSNGVL